MLALADALHGERRTAFVPAGLVAEVWRDSPRQHAVLRMLRAGAVRIDPLTDEVAYGLGRLLVRPARPTWWTRTSSVWPAG